MEFLLKHFNFHLSGPGDKYLCLIGGNLWNLLKMTVILKRFYFTDSYFFNWHYPKIPNGIRGIFPIIFCCIANWVKVQRSQFHRGSMLDLEINAKTPCLILQSTKIHLRELASIVLQCSRVWSKLTDQKTTFKTGIPVFSGPWQGQM